jgi:hypothetical protein
MEMKKEKPMEVEHLKCSSCRGQLTELAEGEKPMDGAELVHSTHFDVTRSNKGLWLVEEEGLNKERYLDIEENEEPNVKMQVTLCEDCFMKVLTESKTIGDLFWNKKERMFLY